MPAVPPFNPQGRKKYRSMPRAVMTVCGVKIRTMSSTPLPPLMLSMSTGVGPEPVPRDQKRHLTFQRLRRHIAQ